MTSLKEVHAYDTDLARTQSLVAVIVGGTAGIGEGTVRALARTYGEPDSKSLRIHIVGRNKAAADATIAYCQSICPKGHFNFIQATDLRLLKDVDRCCAEIVESENSSIKGTDQRARIDFLVCTQNILTFEARRDTPEGLDGIMSLLFYGRMRFTFNLLPLLANSELPKGARVVSVLNPKLEGKMFVDDISVRDPKHYGITTASHVGSMITLMHEEIARRNPGVGLCHVYPGIVMTNAIDTGRLAWWVRWLWKGLIGPILTPWSTSVEECGERTVFLMCGRFPATGKKQPDGIQEQAGAADVQMGSDGVVGSGAYRVNSSAGIIATSEKCKQLREESVSKKVWEHTMAGFKEIEAGRVFTG